MSAPRRGVTLVALLATLSGCRAARPEVMEGSASSRPVLEVSAPRPQVGFGSPVSLRASVQGGSVGERWQLQWRQVWGPPARIRRQERALLEITTLDPPPPGLAAAHRARILPLSAAKAGRQVFVVTASSESGQLERTVEVFPAFPSASWPRMALGVDYYLPSPATRGWEALEPQKLALLPSTAPHLARARANAVDWTEVRHPETGALRVRGGVWLGSKDCGRFDCHPREHGGWQGTAHSSIFRRALSGELSRSRGRYQAQCVACHTLGYQPGAANDGFGDRALRTSFSFPRTLAPRAWHELPTALRERANVQCESCHGPGWFYVSYGVETCAQCHDHPPQYLIVSQLHRNKMSEAPGARSGREGQACKGCHAADGYLESIRGHGSTSKPGSELDTEAQGVTCAACHDPHGLACRRQLRICGQVETPGATYEAGQGALCISCHSGEADIVHGPLLRPFLPGQRRGPDDGRGHASPISNEPRPADAAPHAPQFQLLTGRGGKFFTLPKTLSARPVYPHEHVPDACVGCHYGARSKRSPIGGHTFKLLDDPQPELAPRASAAAHLAKVKRSSATRACASCHGVLSSLNARARGDYDGNGRVEGLVDEVQGLLAMVETELRRQLIGSQYRGADGARGAGVAIEEERMVIADERGLPLRSARGQPFSLGREAPLLQKAAFNWLMIVRDGSGGLHNPQYTVRLLQDTVEGLERSRGLEPSHPWRRP